jgi:Zn ribbon nucleic-acid-binding protein
MALRLRRRFGYGLAGQMQGTFSIGVDAPEDVARVVFLLDGEQIGEDNQSPFSLQFNTGDHATGVHSFSAIGYGADGVEYHSNALARQFVARSPVIIIVVIIVALVIAFRLLSRFIANRGTTDNTNAGYGFMGGAVCPNCGRPFAIHWWSLNLVGNRIDRCRHCKKWNSISRANSDTLSTAEMSSAESDTIEKEKTALSSDKDEWDRKIDQSRYDNR